MIRRLSRLLLSSVVCLVALSILLPLLYRWINPPITLTMISRSIKEGAPIKKQWIPIEEISPYLIQAAVAAEDNLFLTHNGFDMDAIRKAIEHNENSSRLHGGSTISQQTAKNVFLTQRRTWLRKGLEVYFTLLIEKLWSKQRIMEVYLNIIEMGNGIYGAEQAAQTYFNKPANNLTKHQAALLTAIYPNPRHRNPAKPTSYLQNRAFHIESIMSKIGPIDFSKEKELKEKAKQDISKNKSQNKQKKRITY